MAVSDVFIVKSLAVSAVRYGLSFAAEKAVTKAIVEDALVETGVKDAEKAVTEGIAEQRVFQVTPDGVALPPESKYAIPSEYVENPYRSGSYGEVVNGKFSEKLRIDPPTPPGSKGPNYSHYHLNGKSTHYSPRLGERNPGFK
jgi:hypothetical protein